MGRRSHGFWGSWGGGRSCSVVDVRQCDAPVGFDFFFFEGSPNTIQAKESFVRLEMVPPPAHPAEELHEHPQREPTSRRRKGLRSPSYLKTVRSRATAIRPPVRTRPHQSQVPVSVQDGAGVYGAYRRSNPSENHVALRKQSPSPVFWSRTAPTSALSSQQLRGLSIRGIRSA